MQSFHKDTIQHGLEWASTHIQEIESSADPLHEKADRIEWQLIMLLDDVVLALPKVMREQAQACIKVHRQVRKAILDDIDADIARRAQQSAQKETSPASLPALDSF